MATTTTCSRRMIKIKGGMMKKMNKPHAPLPRQRPPTPPSGDEQMVGEEAKAVEFKAPVRPAPPPPAWWQKAMKPAGIAFAVLACAGIGYYMVNAPSKPAYDRSAEVAVAPPVPSMPGRSRTSTSSQAYPGSDQITGPIDLSARSSPTPQSFQASAYVRKKVKLESASGDCVIKSGYDRVTDCVQE